MRVETIVYKGITFRRYPDAPGWSARRYYVPGIEDRNRGVDSLHREIWRDHNGPIPDGHHIHHADFDQDNNDPSNLVCLTPEEHIRVHQEHGHTYPDDWWQHLAAIRPLAAAWHRSDAGRAWHREHAKRAWQTRTPLKRQCEQCSAAFDSISVRADDRFCSNKCKSAWRRASGVDDEVRQCERCGTDFTINRYQKARYCGRLCGARARRAREAAGLQPDG
jgi:hypothetical protein